MVISSVVRVRFVLRRLGRLGDVDLTVKAAQGRRTPYWPGLVGIVEGERTLAGSDFSAFEVIRHGEPVAWKTHHCTIEGLRGFSFEPSRRTPRIILRSPHKSVEHCVRMHIAESG
jgi:hypothetical protein